MCFDLLPFIATELVFVLFEIGQVIMRVKPDNTNKIYHALNACAYEHY